MIVVQCGKLAAQSPFLPFFSPSLATNMADSQDDKLYKAEYAKSGRASCKKCKENIAKDSLRMAIMVQVWDVLVLMFWF